MEKEVLNPAQLAERWSISRHRIYTMARAGILPTLRIGKSVRFRLVDVQAFEATKVQAPTTDKPKKAR